MAYLIGTDEAGYGPNLGPLCVSASIWEVDDDLDPADMYKKLRKFVASSVDRAAKNRVVWADSKAVYKSSSGMDHLERGVLAALALVNRLPREWCDLWQGTGVEGAGATAGRVPSGCSSAFEELPWHADYCATVPLWMAGPEWMTGDSLAELADCLQVGLASCGVRLVGLLSRVVFPGEFNELTESGNKADALSRVTLALVAEALEHTEGPVQVLCDKHGGRNHYLPLLQSQFPDDWIEVRQESGPASNYRFGTESRRVEIGFHVGGERFLPVALASMTAKYLRETAMRPFNEFWCRRIDGLKPTAGYPTDSRRFKQQIAATQRELEIEDRILWRSR